MDDKDKEGDKVDNFNVIGGIKLSSKERQVLNNNPKLAVLERLDDEIPERELEGM